MAGRPCCMAGHVPSNRSIAIGFKLAQDNGAGHALCSHSQQPCQLGMHRLGKGGGFPSGPLAADFQCLSTLPQPAGLPIGLKGPFLSSCQSVRRHLLHTDHFYL